MAKGDDIQERLINFAVAILNLTGLISKTIAGKHIAGQLVRCGTSPAPNYAEARGAESKRDFIHKLGIVLKELNETNIWLIVLIKSKMLAKSKIEPIYVECKELSKIINKSIQTSKVNILNKH